MFFSFKRESIFIKWKQSFFYPEIDRASVWRAKFFFCHDKVYPLFVCPLLEKTNPSSVPPENHLTQQKPPSPHPCDRKMTSLLTF